jgi:DNA repair protein RecN (Recombination protein N)
MLSIKAALAERTELASIIFDEIDTGISGEVADKMGRIILEMGKNTQVIAITHLPQIAAKGARQLKVYKEEKNGVTETRIKSLDPKERMQEIARLLSGEGVSQEALENAKVLLSTS